MELKGTTILITGATSGIGLEFVRQLTKKEVRNIIITGRDPDKLEKAKKQFPNIHTFQSDVSQPKEIEKLYKEVIQQFPELNIIINNAGIMRNLDLQDTSMDLENITSEIEINLSGTIRMVHQFLPHLKTKNTAAIVNVSSGLAFVPFPVSPIYSAAKSGIHAYTQVLRLQLKKTNIKVFELAPPATETSLGDPFEGLVDSKQNMKVDKMVQIAIEGILKNKMEIKPGLAKVLKFMSRLAPDFILNFMDKTIEKAKAKQV
ncbi:SDR family NAD(P)-dependent oxidoreductase [Flavobacterium sp. ANB]|uniref:SDR family oxidoreductase n=1 Tax=unclassified Flavobacterium TaxID=196869 RepID=UPI0012B814BB|nr:MULTISPECIES: SDR family NAD(P)-dependent oxidoreductase [unclassified Flavobacterium]MBF4516943.1 SDR family NAD(P)-dependent oxidoreductase [Flavobacterium sp. ANB]MTD69161.1 SDR family NAD(P)-dependent oxidoreductase [Flavobacterium sp. LC2016-13]